MSKLGEFLSFSDPNVVLVTVGSVLLGVAAAIVGCFTFLRKRALVGDAVAHSILPGVCLAFMLTGTKNPFILLAGATLTGWLSLLAIDLISRKSKIKADTAIGLVLSVFFGLGILMLTSIQHSGNASQAGLDKFLFGKAASMTQSDVIAFGSIAVGLLVVVAIFFKGFLITAFNAEFGKSIGLPIRLYEFLLSTLTVLAVAAGIQAVGVVLMAALLITPASAARFWTDSLRWMILLASVFGAFSGIFGAYISYSAPAMPTGPWIVISLSTVALLSIFLAPGRGILGRIFRQSRNRTKMLRENILKALYQLGEKAGEIQKEHSFDQMMRRREFLPQQLRNGLNQLKRKGLVQYKNDLYRLTDEGLEEAKRIVKLHRLWEMFLTVRMRMPADHVHNNAEAIEHVITPEIEAMLEEELGFPTTDPHDSEIPYRNPETAN